MGNANSISPISNKISPPLKQPTAEEIAKEIIKQLPSGLIPPQDQKTQKAESPTFKEMPDKAKPDILSVSFGGGGVTESISISNLQAGAREPINLGGYKPIRFYLDKGRLFADVSIYGGPNKPPIEVKHNEFTVRVPGFDKNFDDTALEVVNDHNSPVFQLIYKTPYHIVVNGIFPSPSGLMLANNDGFFGSMPFIPKSFKIDTLFKYPSKKFPGQRAEIVRVVPGPHLKQRALSLSADLFQFVNKRKEMLGNDIKLRRVSEETFSLYDNRFAIKCSDIAEELSASGLNVDRLPSDCRSANNIMSMKDVAERLKELAEKLP